MRAHWLDKSIISMLEDTKCTNNFKVEIFCGSGGSEKSRLI